MQNALGRIDSIIEIAEQISELGGSNRKYLKRNIQ